MGEKPRLVARTKQHKASTTNGQQTTKEIIMSTEQSEAKTFTPRKATFTVKLVNGVRQFTPVNKRAKTVAHKLGKRTKITLHELRSTEGKGSYRFYAYTSKGTLKKIAL